MTFRRLLTTLCDFFYVKQSFAVIALRNNIFACLPSVHNAIGLSCLEQSIFNEAIVFALSVAMCFYGSSAPVVSM